MKNMTLKPGTTIYYYEQDNGVHKDEIIEYSEELDMYYLKEIGDWFSRDGLFTNKQKCKQQH